MGGVKIADVEATFDVAFKYTNVQSQIYVCIVCLQLCIEIAYLCIHVYDVYMSVHCGSLSVGLMTEPAWPGLAWLLWPGLAWLLWPVLSSLGLSDWVSLSL